MPDGVAFARLDPDGADQRFQRLRGAIGVTSFGINLIVLEPGQRGRVHRHAEQEEVYLVLEGELMLLLETSGHRLGPWELVRVGPEVRRQLVNRGSRRLVLLALGGHGEHAGRDGIAWADWDEAGDGRPPQEVPLPEDEAPRPSG
jgi:uncharacterized cupin superfamily protein